LIKRREPSIGLGRRSPSPGQTLGTEKETARGPLTQAAWFWLRVGDETSGGKNKFAQKNTKGWEVPKKVRVRICARKREHHRKGGVIGKIENLSLKPQGRTLCRVFGKVSIKNDEQNSMNVDGQLTEPSEHVKVSRSNRLRE